MKKICLAAVGAMFFLVTYAGDPEKVSPKVLEAFNESFADVKNPQWFIEDNSYTVRFIKNEIDTRITYNESARMVKTVRYYKERQLPAFILGKLAEKYEDKSVFGVTETTTSEGITYYVTLQDQKNWLVVVGDASGSFRLDKKYKKS